MNFFYEFPFFHHNRQSVKKDDLQKKQLMLASRFLSLALNTWKCELTIDQSMKRSKLVFADNVVNMLGCAEF